MNSITKLLVIIALLLQSVSAKHIVLTSICSSHFYLTESIARGLVARNHQVTFVLSGECKDRVEKNGAKLYKTDKWNIISNPFEDFSGYIRENNEASSAQLLELVQDKAITKPDIIMADVFLLGVAAIPEKYGIPYVHMYFGMIDFPGIDNKRTSLKVFLGIDDNQSELHRFISVSTYNFFTSLFFSEIFKSGNVLREKIGVSDKFTSLSHIANSYPSFVLLSSTFQISFTGEHVYPLGLINEKYHLPALPKDIQAFIDQSNKDVLYIAFGSTMVPSENIQRALMQYLSEQTNFNVIYARFPDIGLDIPRHVLTAKFIPQRTLLHHPKVKLFLSHCGLNSVTEAIVAETVVICLPLGRDQYASANGVVGAGIAGVVTDGNSKESILSAVESTRKNYKTLHDTLRREKQNLYDIDGISQIERLMEKYKGKSTRIYISDPYNYGHVLFNTSVIVGILLILILAISVIFKSIKKAFSSRKEKLS